MFRRRTVSGGICAFAVSISCFALGGCAAPQSGTAQGCVASPANGLAHYDDVSRQFLDEATRHPSDNSAGNIVWNTRYYMEALLDAYDATGNTKYIDAFVDTGTYVMNEVQNLSVVDVPDPSAPGSTVSSPTINVTGWPTQLGSFSEGAGIPTTSGQTALYAQNLDPTDPNGPVYFQVTAQDGGLTLAWVRANQTLQSNAVQNVSDLMSLASAPLIEGRSFGRIKATGIGLPMPGTYRVNSPVWTIWHEQTGGILLPFARFLLLASEKPGLADPKIVAQWKAEVLTIAGGYGDEFIPDNGGGLLLRNPIWLPNGLAGTNAAADYVAVEATMRMFLYKLTSDPEQLAIAKGLVTHQKNLHWQSNARGWLLLKSWPCLVPWETSANAPAGSIWSAFTFDTTVPASVEEAATFVDLFHEANVLGLASQLGITPEIYSENRSVLLQYLFSDPSLTTSRPEGLLRGAYPTVNSAAKDPLTTSQYALSGAWFVAPEVSNADYVNANWKWMLQFNQNPQGAPVGYFLKSWAMSEAAEKSICGMR